MGVHPSASSRAQHALLCQGRIRTAQPFQALTAMLHTPASPAVSPCCPCRGHGEKEEEGEQDGQGDDGEGGSGQQNGQQEQHNGLDEDEDEVRPEEA